MRKITNQAVSAFNARKNFRSGNTEVTVISCGHNEAVQMRLHGNLIAERNSNGLFVSSAGWETTTTKERLNGLNGVSVNQKKGVWYLNGKQWDETSRLTKV